MVSESPARRQHKVSIGHPSRVYPSTYLSQGQVLGLECVQGGLDTRPGLHAVSVQHLCGHSPRFSNVLTRLDDVAAG